MIAGAAESRRQSEARVVDKRGSQPWLLFRGRRQRQLGNQISMFQVVCEIG
jgi:hypothetical protein